MRTGRRDSIRAFAILAEDDVGVGARELIESRWQPVSQSTVGPTATRSRILADSFLSGWTKVKPWEEPVLWGRSAEMFVKQLNFPSD